MKKLAFWMFLAIVLSCIYVDLSAEDLRMPTIYGDSITISRNDWSGQTELTHKPENMIWQVTEDQLGTLHRTLEHYPFGATLVAVLDANYCIVKIFDDYYAIQGTFRGPGLQFIGDELPSGLQAEIDRRRK